MSITECAELPSLFDQPLRHYDHALAPMAAYLASSVLIKDTKACPPEYLDWLRRYSYVELERARNTLGFPEIAEDELLAQLVADSLLLVLPAIDEVRKKQG